MGGVRRRKGGIDPLHGGGMISGTTHHSKEIPSINSWVLGPTHYYAVQKKKTHIITLTNGFISFSVCEIKAIIKIANIMQSRHTVI